MAAADPRAVFHFHTEATGDRWLDPFAVHRAWYEAFAGDPASVLRAIQPPRGEKVINPDGTVAEKPVTETPEQVLARLRAWEQLLPAVRAVFGLPAWDATTGSGCLDRDVARILREWYEWQAAVKKNTAAAPSSPLPTAVTPQAPSPGPSRRSSPSSC